MRVARGCRRIGRGDSDGHVGVAPAREHRRKATITTLSRSPHSSSDGGCRASSRRRRSRESRPSEPESRSPTTCTRPQGTRRAAPDPAAVEPADDHCRRARAGEARPATREAGAIVAARRAPPRPAWHAPCRPGPPPGHASSCYVSSTRSIRRGAPGRRSGRPPRRPRRSIRPGGPFPRRRSPGRRRPSTGGSGSTRSDTRSPAAEASSPSSGRSRPACRPAGRPIVRAVEARADEAGAHVIGALLGLAVGTRRVAARARCARGAVHGP